MMERYKRTFSGRIASQMQFELESLINFLKERKIARYLEIGARHGDTFHEIMRSLPDIKYGLGVDLPGGLWGRKDTGIQLYHVMNDLIHNHKKNAFVLLGDSQAPHMIDAINSMIFDAVFIDGDHTYEGVSADYKNYGHAPIVIFHDIVGEGEKEKVSNQPVEVPRFWQELKALHKNAEFIEFIAPGSKMGIGIMLK